MNFSKPTPNDTFTINGAAEWPSIVFQTDATGAHTWQWTLTWGSFTKSGREQTASNVWDANAVVKDCGGTLTVRAEASKAFATMTVKIKGTNPNAADVTQYLGTKLDSAGFDKIIQHESKCRDFNSTGEPVKSFDNGYGMCQLTTPTPTFEQVWNWKLNVNGGLNLFSQKRAAAVGYLSQSGRSYTDEQLKYETVCRWNGGAYHQRDEKAGKWIRPTSILCDTKTGNIGWDMTKTENAGKTEADLHTRDSGSYSMPPTSASGWKYSGVCYADRILG